MKERQSPTLVIYNPGCEELEEVIIASTSIRKFDLMQEDYVRLDFILDDPTFFPIGSYIEDPIFGKFVVTEEQMPKYESSTDSYRYELKMDAEYMAFRNKLFMLTYVNNDTGTRTRREASWNLTSKLSDQLDELINNIAVLNGSQHGYNYDISGCDKAAEVHTMSYRGTSIIDALCTLAETWECEWWVTGKTIHMGKCESTDEPLVFSIENGSVQQMDIQDNRNTYANKVWVLGSTKNLPYTYRRKLILSDIHTHTTNNGVFYTADHKLNPQMFSGADTAIVDKIPGIEYDGRGWTPASNYIQFSVYDDAEYSIVTKNNQLNIPALFLTSSYTGSIIATIQILVTGKKVFEKTHTYSFYGSNQADGTIIPVDISGTLNLSKDANNRITTQIIWSGTSGTTCSRYGSLSFCNREDMQSKKVNMEPTTSNVTYPIKVITDRGIETYIVFNPMKVSKYNIQGTIDERWYYFGFTDDQGQSVSAPTGFNQSSTIEVKEKLWKIPSAFFSTDLDDPSSLLTIGDTRLRMPNSTGDCLIQEGIQDAQSVENVVVFDDIYPDGKLYAQAITAEEKKDYTEYDGESVKSDWQWHEYTITPYIVSNDQPFKFSNDFMLPNTELKIRFLTPQDIGDTDPGEGYKLAGMTFGVQFNKSTKTFTIVRNSDFGALLPNDTLKPEVGDPFVLIGWNVYAMQELGLIDDAEQRLLAKGQEYMQAMEESQFTFKCTMSNDWMFSLIPYLQLVTSEGDRFLDIEDSRFMVVNKYDGYAIPGEGQRVKIMHKSLNKQEKTSRIIGYELKLDKPYDSPLYTIGETEAYSRLAKIEKEIQSL